MLALLLLLLTAAGTLNGQGGLFPPAHINVNMGEDRPVTATSVCISGENCNSSLINDGDDQTQWQSATGVTDVNVTVDLQGGTQNSLHLYAIQVVCALWNGYLLLH